MTQFSLFDLDAIPIVEPGSTPEDRRRWYVTIARDGKEYALVDMHANGGTVWSEVGTFKHQPHLYRTYAGAKRQGISYLGWDIVVKEWQGWS